MHSNGPIPVDKNMDEILASIRQTIQEDLNDDNVVDSLYGSGYDNLKSSSSDDQKVSTTGSEVLELTQMINDDGTIVDIKEASSKKTIQPTLRRPYSPLDRTPSSDLRHHPETHIETPDTLSRREFQNHMTGHQSDQIDLQHNDYHDNRLPDGAHDKDLQSYQPTPGIYQSRHHATTLTDTQDVSDETRSSQRPSYDNSTSFESVKPTILKTPVQEKFSDTVQASAEEYIMSDKTIQDSLAALGSLHIPLSFKDDYNKHKSSITSPAQQTIESLVLESLRPLLKEWLDANLPTLVKWVVTEQVERLFKQQQNSHHR